ncbi:phage holin [Limosilactobacillus fermentum]|jgi:LL-H family phage holin|uniref:Holin n=1 Tax=Lactobacillus phage LF1 TaxID=947980 RepID=E9LUK2_9CAUD|nr:phage holin [Limosilactobacillus fermentum]YP_007003224.1 holin [Lactobacillus phage LF1]QHJ74696.1 oxidoreductase [Lactobacillus phage JNU_P1]DAZ35683.1 MAG TPA: holin [Caudoviricetes sp.]ADW01248.1 holin [Lactobacillus phage LF1]UVW04102.1 phage holin [Limosilactobacillus fermentum]WEN04719.1 phage holin [Limosilactobacillus fermentum]
MEINSIADVITAVAAVSLPIIITYLSKWVKGNRTAETIVSILPNLAKDAVVAMQQLGVEKVIKGEAKKSHAVQIVKQALANLGFTNTDEATLQNAIEAAYAQLKADGTLDAYPQAVDTSDEDTKQAEIAKAEAELTSLKEQEETAQKQLDALKGAQN